MSATKMSRDTLEIFCMIRRKRAFVRKNLAPRMPTHSRASCNRIVETLCKAWSLLWIAFGHLRCRLIDFDLLADFLDFRVQFFQTRGKILLLLRDRRLQLFDFVVLFEELVEQHVIDLLVVDARDFTVLVTRHQLGIYVSYFLSH